MLAGAAAGWYAAAIALVSESFRYGHLAAVVLAVPPRGGRDRARGASRLGRSGRRGARLARGGARSRSRVRRAGVLEQATTAPSAAGRCSPPQPACSPAGLPSRSSSRSRASRGFPLRQASSRSSGASRRSRCWRRTRTTSRPGSACGSSCRRWSSPCSLHPSSGSSATAASRRSCGRSPLPPSSGASSCSCPTTRGGRSPSASPVSRSGCSHGRSPSSASGSPAGV